MDQCSLKSFFEIFCLDGTKEFSTMNFEIGGNCSPSLRLLLGMPFLYALSVVSPCISTFHRSIQSFLLDLWIRPANFQSENEGSRDILFPNFLVLLYHVLFATILIIFGYHIAAR